MKVNIPHRKYSKIYDKYAEYRYKNDTLEAYEDRSRDMVDNIVDVVDNVWQKILDFTVNRNLEETVKIEPGDSWNADTTLAMIIHPLLVKLKDTKAGYPSFDDEEIWELPVQVQMMSDSAKWDWIIDEMIWAFGVALTGYTVPADANYTEYRTRFERGFQLFGKYYTGLWS